MSNIRVVVEQAFDFGRFRRMAVLKENTDMPLGHFTPYQGLTLSNENGSMVWKPLKEGERPTDDQYLVALPDREMDEFLKAMTIELVRLGYVTGDPHGTKVKAVEDHLASMHKENDRKHDLITAMLAKIR